ncbi:single-stranded DNA-binding protein [Eoetvoesiella caeni]|uniref:Single-stranded DNA-binding protein n=1 Tax=Eoetvoesiella caeni TaxID=645616 RepID=A0A366H9F6_9BURK|nr:single-stranded DNA-binding protein [Eoetvoesiella caeni]MCI2809701.1 single-stranded DNA-binding protein [Eoetvoesiella caeni]NYT56382.1 single-stranded DNA-binding protein [Eoetvoesiella caeni]RBP38440.1 single-stranded DNA-binding protein [Eoetvoesiella caeni]
MQVFANVGTLPIRKQSKSSGKFYYEMRIAESHRNDTSSEQVMWYSVRIMRDLDPGLAKGDFVKVTGKLKTDFYLSREGKPTGTLLIIAFEASKISKPAPRAASEEQPETATEVKN